MHLDDLCAMLYSSGMSEILTKAYKKEDIDKLDGLQQIDFVHPHLKWLNVISARLGEKSYFRGVVRISGSNLYHRSGKAVGEPHWHISGSAIWGWADDSGHDGGYSSGIEAFDALKEHVRRDEERGIEEAKLIIEEWENNFNKW